MIERAMWRHNGLALRTILIETTKAGDDVIGVRVDQDGYAVYLSPEDADEIADSLRARAELVRRTGPGRVA